MYIMNTLKITSILKWKSSSKGLVHITAHELTSIYTFTKIYCLWFYNLYSNCALIVFLPSWNGICAVLGNGQAGAYATCPYLNYTVYRLFNFPYGNFIVTAYCNGMKDHYEGKGIWECVKAPKNMILLICCCEEERKLKRHVKRTRKYLFSFLGSVRIRFRSESSTHITYVPWSASSQLTSTV